MKPLEKTGGFMRFGYHADIVRPQITETFPKNWEDRLVILEDVASVYCLEPHDMAAAKCIVGREKDRCQIQFLINGEHLDPEMLRRRVSDIDLTPKMVVKVHRFWDSVLEAF